MLGVINHSAAFTHFNHSCLFNSIFSFFFFFPVLHGPKESYPSTPPIWFVDSDDPSLAQVLERLEDVRKGSTLVTLDLSHSFIFRRNDDNNTNYLTLGDIPLLEREKCHKRPAHIEIGLEEIT